MSLILSSEKPLRLLTQACGIGIMYKKLLFRYLCAIVLQIYNRIRSKPTRFNFSLYLAY